MTSTAEKDTKEPEPGIQDILYFYTRKQHTDVATILHHNAELQSSFLEAVDQNLDTSHADPIAIQSLQHIVETVPDTNVIQWILSFDTELDLNRVYHLLDMHKSKTDFTATALEQMLVYNFSMKSILTLIQDKRMTSHTIQNAAIRTDVPLVHFYPHGYAADNITAFTDYVHGCVKGAKADAFLATFLSRCDINGQYWINDSVLSKDPSGGTTMLMSALSKFSSRDDTSEGILKLIDCLLNDSKLDLSKVDSDGRSAIFYLANCVARDADKLSKKLEYIEALLQRPDIDINIKTHNGRNIIQYFIDYYFWVLESGVKQQTQLGAIEYSEAPTILSALLNTEKLSSTTQKACLLYFLTHRVMNTLEVKNPKQWYDTYRKRLADANIGCAKALLQLKHLDINMKSEKTGQTALMTAIQLNLRVHEMMRVDLVKSILHRQPDLNVCDSNDGKTAIMKAIIMGQSQTVTQILSAKPQKCDVNIRDNKGTTALMYALKLEPGVVRTEILCCLAVQSNLENYNFQDDEGNSILHILLQDQCFKTVSQLLELKSKSFSDPLLFDLENKKGQTVFDIIIQLSQLSARVEEDGVQQEMQSALGAIFRAILYQSNVNINATFRHGRTLLHLCTLNQAIPLFDICLSCDDIDVNRQDDNGFTPLMYAIHSRSSGSISETMVSKLLMNALCDVTIKNKKGQTISDIANEPEATVNEHVCTLVNVVYTRSKTANAQMLMSNISLEDQLKFLSKSVQSHESLNQKLKDDISTQLSCIQTDIAVHTGGRFGSDFKMADEHRRKLNGLRAFLCEEVTPKDLFAHLIADDILTDDLVEEILAEKTRRRMCEKLLSMLPLRGKYAFQSFINALENEGQDHVAQTIMEYDPDVENNKETKEKGADSTKGVVSPLDGLDVRLHNDEPYAVIPLRFMTQYQQTYARPTPAYETNGMPSMGSQTHNKVTEVNATRRLAPQPPHQSLQMTNEELLKYAKVRANTQGHSMHESGTGGNDTDVKTLHQVEDETHLKSVPSETIQSETELKTVCDDPILETSPKSIHQTAVDDMNPVLIQPTLTEHIENESDKGMNNIMTQRDESDIKPRNETQCELPWSSSVSTDTPRNDRVSHMGIKQSDWSRWPVKRMRSEPTKIESEEPLFVHGLGYCESTSKSPNVTSTYDQESLDDYKQTDSSRPAVKRAKSMPIKIESEECLFVHGYGYCESTSKSPNETSMYDQESLEDNKQPDWSRPAVKRAKSVPVTVEREETLFVHGYGYCDTSAAKSTIHTKRAMSEGAVRFAEQTEEILFVYGQGYSDGISNKIGKGKPRRQTSADIYSKSDDQLFVYGQGYTDPPICRTCGGNTDLQTDDDIFIYGRGYSTEELVEDTQYEGIQSQIDYSSLSNEQDTVDTVEVLTEKPMSRPKLERENSIFIHGHGYLNFP